MKRIAQIYRPGLVATGIALLLSGCIGLFLPSPSELATLPARLRRDFWPHWSDDWSLRVSEVTQVAGQGWRMTDVPDQIAYPVRYPDSVWVNVFPWNGPEVAHAPGEFLVYLEFSPRKVEIAVNLRSVTLRIGDQSFRPNAAFECFGETALRGQTDRPVEMPSLSEDYRVPSYGVACFCLRFGTDPPKESDQFWIELPELLQGSERIPSVTITLAARKSK